MIMLNRFSGNLKSALGPCICAIGLFLPNAHAQTAPSGETKNYVLIPIDDDLFVPVLVSATSPSPSDPARLAEMRKFNVEGNAIVDRLSGDSMQSLAQDAYGDRGMWWVIAEANKVMSDTELSTLSRVIIPNIENVSWNPHVIQVDDDGVSFHYFNPITGITWQEYYIPIVSQLDPPDYEDNPNWLQGLAFVNGNDITSFRPDGFYISRSYPYPRISGAKLLEISVSLPEMEKIQLPLDLEFLEQLATYTQVDAPPPPIKSVPGSDPRVAVKMLEKFPEEVLYKVYIHGVKIVTVKDSVVEVAPEMATRKLPSWGNDVTWRNVPGMYDPWAKVVVIATNSVNHGSVNLAAHEFVHAYDDAMGKLSATPEFEAAFNLDYRALEKADGSGNGYYSMQDDPGSLKLPPTFTRARSEAFAEGMARYFNGSARWFADKPSLLRYFQSWSRPQPVGR
jgi:hypothetical protein